MLKNSRPFSSTKDLKIRWEAIRTLVTVLLMQDLAQGNERLDIASGADDLDDYIKCWAFLVDTVSEIFGDLLDDVIMVVLESWL
jgi:hypothetical protein